MSDKKSSKILPFMVAGVCLLAGLGVGVFTNMSGSSNVTPKPGQSIEQAKEEQELREIQKGLKSASILPTDFKQVPEFSLLNVDAEPINQTIFDDKWSVVFFGFTHCPDVCPITLSVMQDVVTQLKTVEVPQPQTVFVSVDPNRDTPEVMKTYINYFNKDFVGITGDLNNTHQLTRGLGIVTAFTAREDDPNEYDVDHTASMLLIDPEGRMRAKLTAPHNADTIVADYTAIMEALVPTQAASLN